ncbi:GAF domain-containing sensor histidine kinase [Agromyces humatus]|uniref:histidine kinase n=1 Tax=Agromyces humatus TaxID=279573 RepID=A0ABN2KSC9_9MICO|nr:GAF domain-containing protein [Agromyces humatus]
MNMSDAGPSDTERAALQAAAALIAGGASPRDLLDTVARFAAQLLSADYVAILQFSPGDLVEVRAAWAATGDPTVMLDGWSLSEDQVTRRLIDEGASVREEEWAKIDDAVGVALRHRFGVRASVGVPVLLGSHVWGALFVHSTRENLPGDAELRLEAFARLIAASVANARTRAQLQQLLDEQAALRRVAEAVARAVPPFDVFAVVAEELGRLFKVRGAKLIRYNDDGTGTFVASWGPLLAGTPTGTTVPTTGTSVAGLILATGLPSRVDDFGPVVGALGAIMRSEGLRSAAGAPIRVDGRLWGALIVGSEDPQPLPHDTEARIAKFAELVSLAMSNLEARAELQSLLEEQAALRRVATTVARGDRPAILTTILDEAVALSSVDGAAMLRFEPDESATVVSGSGEPAMAGYVGARIPLQGDNPAAIARRTGRPARQDIWEGATGQLAEMTRAAGITGSVAVPIRVDNQLWGVIVVVTLQADPLPNKTERRMGQFAELVATAIGNLESRTALVESRARIVRTVDETRRRLERDLHDGIQQRLVAQQIELARIHALLPPDEPARSAIEQVRHQLGESLESLRELSRGVHPAILSEGGLERALRGLVRRSPIAATLRMREIPTLTPSVEIAAYYLVSEALTNAAKHARGAAAVVEVKHSERRLRLLVRDDGDGGADPSQGSGLLGLIDRVEALGGTMAITSPPGQGTTIIAEFPVDIR